MPKIATGDFVEARGRRWLVEDVMAGPPSRHRLICIDDDAQGETLEANLSAEVDAGSIDEDGWDVLAAAQPEDPITLGAHLRAMRWRTASSADRKLFQAPFRAGIRVDAYQLLPLQRALDLPRANLLIADDVGLGKTVEAGLIARELLLRRRIDFMVIAAPSSMILQWQDEMAQKFGLDVTIIDRAHLIEARRSRGFGANPWVLGSCFAISHTLLSDETYVAPLRELLGEFRGRSLFILDEAHHAAPASGRAYAVESQMTRAVRDLARRFEHRLFLSATPHNGHSNSFATLLEILDPQRFTRGIPVEAKDLEPVMIRRLKEDLRRLGQPFPQRVVEPIVIDGLPSDAPELKLAKMLRDYWDEVGGAVGNRLLLGVLQQRLFSSLRAFGRSLRAHRRTLAGRVEDQPVDHGEDVEAERLEDDDAHVGELTNAPGEITAIARIDAMLALCDVYADGPDARIEAILEWIDAEMLDGAEWRPRRLILFTEWEDTRRWLIEALREGLAGRGVDDADRIEVFTGQTSLDHRDRIKRAFNAPFDEAPVRILVCTDAAREGINLQARCHDLIHVDLPWNPSRLEQRNGRIDRKLQPRKAVSCRYFVYAQRDEDRVLDALVRKTETIREELGPAGEVIREGLRDRLAGGIARGRAAEAADDVRSATSDRTAVAARELGDEGRLDRLRKQEAQLARAREVARERVGVVPKDLQSLVELSLHRMGAAMEAGAFTVPDAQALDPASPAFSAPAWQRMIDELRPGRAPTGRDLARWRQENPPRGVVFAPPVLREGEPEPQDVVQLHLEHRLVKRLLERFVARGFQDRLNRVAAIRAPTGQHRVILMARLALFGPAARRLHEEVVTVTAPWRDVDRDVRALEPFKKDGEGTTLRQLQDALQDGMALGRGVSDRIAPWVTRDVADLRPHVEARARRARVDAVDDLRANGAREAKVLRELLERQLQRIEREQRDVAQHEITFDDIVEERQRQADRRAWVDKLGRLKDEMASEPVRVQEGYEVVAERLDPVGLVYLWPAD